MRVQKPRKTVIGRVVSARMEKTIRVAVSGRRRHPVYNKYVPVRTVLMAHDEKREAKAGDIVEVSFTRPLSKTKRWKLDRILEKAE